MIICVDDVLKTVANFGSWKNIVQKQENRNEATTKSKYETLSSPKQNFEPSNGSVSVLPPANLTYDRSTAANSVTDQNVGTNYD